MKQRRKQRIGRIYTIVLFSLMALALVWIAIHKLCSIRGKAGIPRSISRAPLTLRAGRAKPNIEITRPVQRSARTNAIEELSR